MPPDAPFRAILPGEVLQNCIHELVAEASHAGGSHFASEESRISSRVSRPRVRGAVPVILRAMGLLEWSGQQRPCASMAYQWAARTAIGLIVAASIWLSLGHTLPLAEHDSALAGRCRSEGPPCWQHVGFLSQVPLHVGAVLTLLLVGLRRQQRRLEDTFWLVRGVSVDRGYFDWEMHQHRRDAVVFLVIWLSAVSAVVLNDSLAPIERGTAYIALRQCFAAVCSAVVLSLAYGVVCVCRSLIVMVDAFCCDIVGAKRLPEVAHIWNVTQACGKPPN